MKIDHSEDGTSSWILSNLPLPAHGTWVDVGCGWPLAYSQTAFLRELGWSGLAIDANPAYANDWHGVPNTKFIAAVVSDDPEINFLIEPTNAQVSRKHETGQRVKCVRLDDILEREDIWKVDFLAVDVENMELDVVKSIDFEMYRPTIIVAEFDSQHAGQNFGLLNYLVGLKGYRVVHLSPNNATFYKP